MSGAALLNLAEAWATVVHEGQSRKGDRGEDYIEHPMRMAENARGWYRKVLCWMHDVIEDAEDPEVMFFAVKAVFGGDIARDLLFLSRLSKAQWLVVWRHRLGLPEMQWPDGEKQIYQEWIHDIAESGNQNVIAVKLEDLNDNLADNPNHSRYVRAKATLLEAVA